MSWELIPALIGGGTAVNSGIKGKQAGNEANARQRAQDGRSEQMMTTGMGMMEDFQNQGQAFLNGPTGDAGRLRTEAMTGGAALKGQLTGIGDQLKGIDPSFNFQAGTDTMDQAMSAFQGFADNSRNSALEQAGTALTSGGDALDAAMASRGISRSSGVAAGAMGDMAMQGAQARVGLERDLSNQAGQIGLDATKFDINRMLQEQGMQSNFALQAGAQKGQNLANAGSAYSQAYTTPLGMQQDLYQQNQMNPYMQMMGMSNPMDLIGMAYQGFGNATAQAGQNAAQGGAGMGSGMAGMTSQMFDFLSNKNESDTLQTTGYQPGSQNG